jgi:1-acyl-sn-glycerol-3-phosphate acyltransferase
MSAEPSTEEVVEDADLFERLRKFGALGAIESLAQYIEEQTRAPAFQRDADYLEWLLPLMDRFASYFDAEVHGLDLVPDEGGMLLVGNHSGAPLVPDTPALISAWYKHFGLERKLLGLAHDAMFAIAPIERLMRQIGQMPASPENAAEALERGDALLVYPGGAYEAFRPWTERNRLDFAGHKGFVRLALRTGVPVYPVVAHGGHESTVVLARGDEIVRRFGLDRVRGAVAPLVWQVPWGVSIPLLPGIPLPAKINVHVCAPLDWSGYGPEAADEPEVVDRCYDEITLLMQEKLSHLAESNPYPLLARAWGLLQGLSGQRG